MKVIWDKVNDWKFWALSNEQEEFYQLLLDNRIHSTKGVVYQGPEPFLLPEYPTHRILSERARQLLDPVLYEEFKSELFLPKR